MTAATEFLSIAPGDWNYDCVGPVRALVALAQGGKENDFDLSPARIGAATTSVIAAMLCSAADRSSPVDVMRG